MKKYLLTKIMNTKTLKRWHRKYGMSGKEELAKSKNVMGYLSYGPTQKLFIHPKTTIGKFCSIAEDVVISPGRHPTQFISTHPFQYIETPKNLLLNHNYKPTDFTSYQACTIGNDVWIGMRVIIMDGLIVGDGAIIAANTVVTRDIEPYEIYLGPSRKDRRYRFSATIREKLLALRWWDLEDALIATLPFNDIEKCIGELTKMRERNP